MASLTKALLGLVLSAVLFAPLMHAQSPAIAVERSQYFRQVGATSSTSTLNADGVSLNFNIRGGATDMSSWAPTFYKPGTSQTPQTGASSDTNTGTLNFSATPNNGIYDYMFVHEFASTSALEAFYPNGAYGIIFQNEAALEPSSGKTTFTAGLQFDNSNYPGATPEITNVDNGAVWTPGGGLVLAKTGLTTFTISNYTTEYNSATYGAVIGVGIYETVTGNVVSGASKESYNLPMGDSSATPTPHYDAPFTQFSIDSSWLTPGVSYTIELHFTVFSSRPEEANLTPTGGSPIEFQGVASARKITTLTVMVSPPAVRADFNHDGHADILWDNTSTGASAIWFMNGTTLSSASVFATHNLAWKPRAVADFNGDGEADILWDNPSTGGIAIWLMNGSTMTSSVSVGTRNVVWTPRAAADFNGDGKPDILWDNTSTGAIAVWFMDGTTMTGSASLGTRNLAWTPNGAADFNGDGKTDIVWDNSSTGGVAVWLMDGATYVGAVAVGTHAASARVAATQDYDNDGNADLLIDDSSTGALTAWLMNGTAIGSTVNVATHNTAWVPID